mmetsp:Transcript_17489/g.51135  ORF Transcript_17489/g.51135 Transcript_17489/m.51135 type:complete len:219 (+) Transcript_17489:370-1026(+)
MHAMCSAVCPMPLAAVAGTPLARSRLRAGISSRWAAWKSICACCSATLTCWIARIFTRFSGTSRHPSNPAVSAALSRFLPMKTSLFTRGSAGPHNASRSKLPSKIMCTAWYTNLHGALEMARTPFIRKMSLPKFWRRSPTHSLTSAPLTSPGRTMLSVLTESSCWCSASVSRNSGSISRVRFKSKPRILSTWSTDTLDWQVRTTGALVFMDRSLASMR